MEKDMVSDAAPTDKAVSAVRGMDEPGLQDATAVRVAVRVRPLITREMLQGSRICITTDGPCVTVGRDRRFTFDHAFGPNSQQEHIYQELVSPLVESCFDGFNVTVLAYGQTGSGKTFTMGTGECGPGEQLGIAPRVIRHVFQGIEARKRQAAFYVRAQFLEIYNEDVKDLLMPPTEQAVKWISREQAPALPPASAPITMRDAGDGTIMVIGATEESAECAEDLEELLERGMALRATSSTCANEQSSRSHAILTIIIEQHILATGSVDSTSSDGGGGGGGGGTTVGSSCDGQGGGGITGAAEVRTAKLHLVDLAGSERTKQLRNSLQGARFRETVNINQGLLALGNVISALGDERRRGSHVPYRASKLTRLLQDSLGGNSRTAMIACISPADEVLEETLNTLKYANRARNIRNKPVVNRVIPTASQSPLCSAVADMQLQVLQQLAAHLPDSGLPLAELAALDPTDPGTCLEVLSRMKAVLAGGSNGGSFTGSAGRTAGSDSSRERETGRQPMPVGWGPRSGGGAGGLSSSADVEALVSGCSRAIAGILQGLAEMEAQGHIDPKARDHILRSLDASTLRLLPAVRSLGPRASAGGTALVLELAQQAASAAAENGAASPSDRERVLEERIRSLESELAACREDLQNARDDLDRDEIIFADKMKEMQDLEVGNSELTQRLQEAEGRHAKEAEELKKQIATLTAAAESQAAVGRNSAPGRAASRGRLRPQSGPSSTGGGGPARHRSSGDPVPGCQPGSVGGGSANALAAAAREAGSDSDGERGGEEDEVLYDEELLSYISETDYTEQHRREVLESDAALREELAEVLRQKAAAEAERAALERAALAQRSSFDNARTALEQQLAWLSENISKQQQQLQAAQAAEREARDLAARWQERAQELEAAIEAREAALSKLRSELHAVESNAARSVEERAALRQQYEERIATVVAQVSNLQRQLQQHANSGSHDRRMQSAERASALEAELSRMRAQQTELRKQLSERVAKYERESAARIKELAVLRKAAVTARSRMQALEAENRSQRMLLKEKQQAVLAAEQRLRESQRSISIGNSGTRSRSSSPGSRGYLARANGGPTAAPAAGDATGSAAGSTEGLPAGTRPVRNSLAKPGSGGGAGGSYAAAQRRSISPAVPRPPLAGGGGGGSRTNASGRAPANAQQEDDPALGDGAAGNRRASQGQVGTSAPEPSPTPQQEKELREWAEQLLSVVAEVSGVESRVQVLAARNQELQGRRDLLLREQAQYGLRTQRRAEQLVRAVAACEVELAELVGRIPSPRYGTPAGSEEGTPREYGGGEVATQAPSAGSTTAGAGCGGGGGGGRKEGISGGGGRAGMQSEEWVALQQRIAEVSHAKASLEERLRHGRLLDEREQQVMDALDDQLDDLETQLSYVAGELADQRADSAQLARARDQLQQRAADLGAPGLRLALSAATEALGQRSFQVRQLEAALAASEAGAARREAQMQMRLRESLVSLSAHLASLEASSPGSSACLNNSAELRSLLGIYLDLHPQPGPTGAGPAQHGSGSGAPPGGQLDAALFAQRGTAQPAAGTAGANVANLQRLPSSGGGAPPAPQPLSSRTPLPTAAEHRPVAGHAARDAMPMNGGPTCATPSVEGILRESSTRGVGQGPQQQQQQHPQQRRILPIESEGGGSVARCTPRSSIDSSASSCRSISGPANASCASNDRGTGAPGRTGAVPAAAAAHDEPCLPQPPSAHQQMAARRTISSSNISAGAGGILRRTGSMDSVGSTASSSGAGTAKRVTWANGPGSASVTVSGSFPGVVGALPPGPLVQGPPVARIKERSILDRAAEGLLGGASVRGGAGGEEPSSRNNMVEAAALGVGVGMQQRGEEGAGRRRSSVLDDQDEGGASGWNADMYDGKGSDDRGERRGSLSGEGRGSGGGGGGGGSNGDSMQHPVPPARPPRSLAPPAADLDDTLAAACRPDGHGSSGGDQDSRDAAGEGGGGPGGKNGGLRSFNPWRSAAPGKQRRITGEPLQQEQEGPEGECRPGPRRSSGGGSCERGEDDLLLTQDSDALLPYDGGEELGHGGTGQGPLPLPPSNTGRPEHRRDVERPQTQPPPWHQHQQQQQQRRVSAGGELPRDESGRFVGVGVGAARTHPGSDRIDSGPRMVPGMGQAATVGGGTRCDVPSRGGDEDDDDELEEHVRLLAQAAAVASSQGPPPVQVREQQAPPSVSSAQPTFGHHRGGRTSASEAVRYPDESTDSSLVMGGPVAPRPAAVGTTGRRQLEEHMHAMRNGGGGRAVHGLTGGRMGSAGSGQRPFPAPARSVSPVPQNSRMQRQRPGAFTSPPPVTPAIALSEALMPYKAHLKRSGATPTSGGGAAVVAGRTKSPETRRQVPATTKPGLDKPQPHHQGPAMNTRDADDAPAGVQRQGQQQQHSPPWRQAPQGPSVGFGSSPAARHADRDERYAVPMRGARPRGFKS